MKKLLTITLAAVCCLFVLAIVPEIASAQSPKDAACEGLQLTGGSCTGGSSSLNDTIETVINILSLVVGVAAVIMIIVGGLKYITSTGDSASVNSAKNTILYAVIGLVIVAMAQVIVRFVLTNIN